MTGNPLIPLALAVLIGATPQAAAAQVSFDLVGTRALGMGGAFVAVADDPNAGHWNPGGFVGGPLVGLTIGSDEFQFRHQDAPPRLGAGRQKARTVALGAWPIGISVTRWSAAGITANSDGSLAAEAVRATQVGVSVLQTVVDGVVVGGTVKFLRGTPAIAAAGGLSTDELLDLALSQPGQATGVIDFDLGIMVGSDRLRGGLTLKNLRRPVFAPIGGKPIVLERRARIGLAAFPRDGVTLAIDVDLDTADPLVGLRRTIALGGEAPLGARLIARGGIRWQRGGGAQPVGALGGSVRLRQGLWLDGYATHGRSGDRGFGLAMRVGS